MLVNGILFATASTTEVCKQCGLSLSLLLVVGVLVGAWAAEQGGMAVLGWGCTKRGCSPVETVLVTLHCTQDVLEGSLYTGVHVYIVLVC